MQLRGWRKQPAYHPRLRPSRSKSPSVEALEARSLLALTINAAYSQSSTVLLRSSFYGTQLLDYQETSSFNNVTSGSGQYDDGSESGSTTTQGSVSLQTTESSVNFDGHLESSSIHSDTYFRLRYLYSGSGFAVGGSFTLTEPSYAVFSSNIKYSDITNYNLVYLAGYIGPYSLNNLNEQYFLHAGTHRIDFRGAANSDNLNPHHDIDFHIELKLTGSSIDTTTSVTSAPNPSAYGQDATFSATVAPAIPGLGVPTPTGTVTFMDGTSPLGPPVELDASGTATFTTNALTRGTHDIKAVYNGGVVVGDALQQTVFNASESAPTTHFVTFADTATFLTSSPNPSLVGQSVVFTAAVTTPGFRGPLPPGGMVTFTEGTTVLGSASLVGDKASITTSFSTAGSHQITAEYRGDGNYFGSAGLTTQIVTEPPTPPAPIKLDINYLSSKSFIATDDITLRATIGTSMPGVQVAWTVQGQDAAADIEGFPTNFATTTDANGIATFTFTPSNNAKLVKDRRTNWTRGSRAANPAITFEVTARVVVGGVASEASLSATNLGPLTQDETDRLRQEYYDYNIPVPARTEVVASLGAGFNQGNYGVQLSVGLEARYNAILAAYRGRGVMVTVNGQQYNTVIPNNAVLTISSGYRNPQRNKAVGSLHPDSMHTRGRALDLVPNTVQIQIVVNGRPMRVTLSRQQVHQVLYPALHAAASTQGSAIAEQGSRRVDVGDESEDHIHVQW